MFQPTTIVSNFIKESPQGEKISLRWGLFRFGQFHAILFGHICSSSFLGQVIQSSLRTRTQNYYGCNHMNDDYPFALSILKKKLDFSLFKSLLEYSSLHTQTSQKFQRIAVYTVHTRTSFTIFHLDRPLIIRKRQLNSYHYHPLLICFYNKNTILANEINLPKWIQMINESFDYGDEREQQKPE